MATRDEVLQALGEQRKRFLNEKVVKVFQNWTRTMQYHFPDIDAYFFVTVENGQPGQIQEGETGKAEIRYEMSTDTFLAIARKEISGMKAYTQKLVKVKASMPDLMKLQKLDSV
jgi:hypothetical protein